MFRKKKGQLGASNSGSTFSLNKSGKSFFEKLFNKDSKSKSQNNLNQIGLSVNDGFDKTNIDSSRNSQNFSNYVLNKTFSRNSTDASENFEVYGKYAQVQRKKQKVAEKYFSKRQLSIEEEKLSAPQISMFAVGIDESIPNGAYNVKSIQKSDIKDQTKSQVEIPKKVIILASPPLELPTQQTNIVKHKQPTYTPPLEPAKQTVSQTQKEETEPKHQVQTKELSPPAELHLPSYEANKQEKKPKDSLNSIEQLMIIAQQAQQQREADQQKLQQNSKLEVKSLRQMRKAVTTGSPQNRSSSNTANTIPYVNNNPSSINLTKETVDLSTNDTKKNVNKVPDNTFSIVETTSSIDKPVIDNANALETIDKTENNKDEFEQNLSEQIKSFDSKLTTSEHVEIKGIQNKDKTIESLTHDFSPTQHFLQNSSLSQHLSQNPLPSQQPSQNPNYIQQPSQNITPINQPQKESSPVILPTQSVAPTKPPRMSPEGATFTNNDVDEAFKVKTIMNESANNTALDSGDGHRFYNSNNVYIDGIEARKHEEFEWHMQAKNEIENIKDHKSFDDKEEKFEKMKIDKNKNVSKIVIKNNEIIINNENKIPNHSITRHSFMPTSNNILNNTNKLYNDVEVSDHLKENTTLLKERDYNEEEEDEKDGSREDEQSETIKISFEDEVRDSGFVGDMVTNIDDEIDHYEQKIYTNSNNEEYINNLEERDVMAPIVVQHEQRQQETQKIKKTSSKPGRFSLNAGSQETHTAEENIEDHEYFRRKQKSEITSKRGSMRGVKDAVKTGVNAFFNIKEQSTLKKLQKKSRGRVTLFTTSMGVIRKTFDQCMHVKKILQNHRVYFIEKDVYISEENSEELMNRFRMQMLLSNDERDKRQSRLGSGDPFTRQEYEEMLMKLPRVFVEDLDLGGYNEVLNLNETDVLKKIFQDFKKVEGDMTCAVCGGFNYTPCSVCHGSKKIWRSRSDVGDDEMGVYIGNKYHSSFNEELMTCLKCTKCDANGLVRCTMCDEKEEDAVEIVRVNNNTHRSNNNRGTRSTIAENNVTNGGWIVEEVAERSSGNMEKPLNGKIHDYLNGQQDVYFNGREDGYSNGKIDGDSNGKIEWNSKKQPYIEYDNNSVFDIELPTQTKRGFTKINLKETSSTNSQKRHFAKRSDERRYTNGNLMNGNENISDSEA